MVHDWKGNNSNFFRYFFSKTNKDIYCPPDVQLYVIYRSDSWAFLDRAFNIEQQLETTLISHDTTTYYNKVGIEEHIGVGLPLTYLADHKEQGIKVKLYGRKGTCIVTVPPIYVQGFIQKLNDVCPKCVSGEYSGR